MIKKGTDKHFNKISGRSSLYEIQCCSSTSESTINGSEKYHPKEAAKTQIHIITTFPHARSWLEIQ